MSKFLVISIFFSVLFLSSCIDLEEVQQGVDELNPFADAEYNGSVTLSGDYQGEYGMYFRALVGDNIDDEYVDEEYHVMRIIGRDDTGEFGLRQFELLIDLIETDDVLSNIEVGVYPLEQIIDPGEDAGVYGASFHWHTEGQNFIGYWRDVEGELRITDVAADTLRGEFEFKVYRTPNSSEYVEVTNGSFAMDIIEDIIMAN